MALFIAIPLTQKLADFTNKSSPPPPEFTVEPPAEQDFEVDEPPDEPEPEPEPEEMMDEPSDLDMALDLGSFDAGTGGGFVMDVPKFGQGGGNDPFGAGDLDAPPTPVQKMPPVYPSSLLSKGVGGRVVVRCVVATTGRVSSARIHSSSGHTELDKAAVNAVNKWKFKPGTRSGRAVKSTCNVPFNFEVKKN